MQSNANACVAEEYLRLVIHKEAAGADATKFVITRKQGDPLLTAQSEDGQFIVRDPAGAAVLSIRKVHHRVAHRVWYIQNNEDAIVYTARMRLQPLSAHDKVQIYNGEVQFSRLTGQPDGSPEVVFEVERPAPDCIRNLQLHQGIFLVADATEERLDPGSSRDLVVRVQRGANYAFVVLALLIADASKEFDKVTASPGLSPSLAPMKFSPTLDPAEASPTNLSFNSPPSNSSFGSVPTNNSFSRSPENRSFSKRFELPHLRL